MSRIPPLSLVAIMLIVIVLPVLLVRSCRRPASERPPAVKRTPIPSPGVTFNHDAACCILPLV